MNQIEISMALCDFDMFLVIGLCVCASLVSYDDAVAGESSHPRHARMRSSETRRPKVKSTEVFIKSPRAACNATAYYTRGQGVEKVCYMSTQSRSDTADTRQRRFSKDNGQTWSDWETVRHMTPTKQGTHRLYPLPGWVDPKTGRLLTMVIEGTLPTDKPLEGLKHWALRYRVSVDGGRTSAVDEPVVQKGAEYSPKHPIDGVWIGKSSFMIGTSTCRPILTRRGHILVPVQITPVGPNGEYHNPGGGYTYHDCAVLIGRWTDGLKIEWDVSQRVIADPKKSTRGCIEPTIIEAPDGRILMVMRGSNHRRHSLPNYKWYSISKDGGFHWAPPKPWTYANGAHFFSPCSCSQLLKHSNGRIYWIGNISPYNPKDSRPRYPLVIGEVDPKSLLLIEDTISTIDTRRAGEGEDLQLSNFLAYEDRKSHEIILHMTRFFHKGGFRGDAYLYQIQP